MRAAIVGVAVLATASARADELRSLDPARAVFDEPRPPDGRRVTLDEPRPLVGLRVEGDTKTSAETVLRLARLSLGDELTVEKLAEVEAALVSSQLFKSVELWIEDGPGGVVLVALLVDKHSWVAAPTLYLLPDNWSVGVGFAENNLFGEDKKLLLYGQYGNVNSFFFGTYLDPAVNGTRLQMRFDVYFVHRRIHEYRNDPDMPTDDTIERTTTWTFFDIGILFGWRFYWWLTGDIRLKPSYALFTNFTERPEKNGWDNSIQLRLTLDRRQRRRGVAWGPFVQLFTDVSIPGLDDYQYQLAALRAYYSWRLWPESPRASTFLDRFGREHQLELRTSVAIGRHLPMHEELTLGGVSDVRGYSVDMFRGDRRVVGRAEYSVQLATWRMLTLRAIGFYDAGFIGFYWRSPTSRDYLPTQHDGAHWFRSNVGGGLRVYVGNIVLPLLGLDIAYGLEGKRREVYFEVGLTDF